MRPRIWPQAFGFREAGWLAARPPPPGWEEEEAWTHKSVAKAKALTSALSLLSRARVRCGRYRDEKDAKLLVDPTRKYSEILRVLELLPTAKNVQQSKEASKAQGISTRTHARWLNNNTLDCLFVCWLVVAEKRTTSLRYQFPTLPLIITHFLSNSSFPTSIAATSSAATTTTMTTTYDQEVVVFLAVKKDKTHHRQQQYQQLQASSTKSKTIHRHTQREGKLQKRKETRDPAGSQEWARQENQVNERLFFTNQQQQSHYNRNQASKQAQNPSEFFLFFFPS